MGLFDAFGTDAPYDPGQGVDDLARQVFPDDVGPGGPVDPGRLADAVARRQDRKTRHIDEKPPEVKPPSAYGDLVKEPGAITKPPSAYGDLVEPDEVPLGVTGNVKAALKGIPNAVISGAGSFVQGAAIKNNTPEPPEAVALIDQLGQVPTMTPAQRAQLSGQALRSFGSRGNQMDFNAAVQRVAAGADPATEMQGLKTKIGAWNAQPSTPVEDRPLYKGGAAIKVAADSIAPMTDQEKDSFGGMFGRGIGGAAIPVAIGAINPVAGVVAGGAMFAGQSAGDTFEAAIKKGASDEDAAKAAGYSALVGGALGTIPIGVILAPVKKFAPGMTGWAADALNKIVASPAYRKTLASAGTMAAVVEAQEKLGDVIAQHFYEPKYRERLKGEKADLQAQIDQVKADPNLLAQNGEWLAKAENSLKTYDEEIEKSKAGYSPEIKRIIASLVTGGILGGAHAYMEGRKKPGEPPPTPDDITPDDRREGLPPPGPGPGPGPGPDPGPGPSPDPGPGPGPDPGPGKPPPGTGEGKGPEFKMDARMRAKFEKLYRTFGGDPTGMADHELFNALNEHMRDTSSTGYTAKPETPEEAAARQEAATERTEREGLKRAGWTDAHINVMTPAERRKRFQDAMARGSASERPPPEQPETPKSNETTGDGTRDKPIVIKTADDVLKASEVVAKNPTDPQAAATNFKHGHAEIPHLGLTGSHSISIETGVGDTRKSKPGDRPWEVTMPVAYGRIKGTKGADGEPLDVFIGSHPDSQHVFIIDQHHGGGKGFDEHKIMTGFHNPIEALHAYANSYTDGGGDRIGGMKAFTPDEFKSWLKSGDHTKPVSAIGNASVIPPDRVTAEPTREHHAQIEAALGENYHHVLPVDTARAAEILAENEGMDPAAAFGQAVIENAVAQKFLTHQQAEQAYGEEVNEVLEPGGEGASGGSASPEQERPTPGEVGAGHSTEAPIVPSGGKAGAQGETGEGSTATGNTGTGTTVKPADGGNETAGDKTGDTAEDKLAAENANDSIRDRIEDAYLKVTGGKYAESASLAKIRAALPDLSRAEVDAGLKRILKGDETASLMRHDDPKQIDKAMQDAAYNPAGEPFHVLWIQRPRTEKPAVEKPTKDLTLEDVRKAHDKLKATGSAAGGVAYIGDILKDVGGSKERLHELLLAGAKAGELTIHPATILPADMTQAQRDAAITLPGHKEPFVHVNFKPKKAPTVDEPVVPEPEKQKIEDAGEKIGGARKDQWVGKGGLTAADLDGMTGGELVTNVTKHNIWPRPDYAAAVDSGVDPVAAALMKRIYDRISVKPGSARETDDNRRRYFIKALHAVRDEFAKAKTVDDMRKLSGKVGDALGTDSYGALYILRQESRNGSPLYISNSDIYVAEKAVAAGFPNMEPWQRLFAISENLPYDHTTRKYADKPEFHVYRKNGGSIGRFATRELAEAAAKEAYAKIGKEGSGEQEPNRPHLDHVNREGPDYRKDRDVTGDDFIKDFGFRGVEFGNWVAGDERQKVVNLAYDALHDLARVLNLPAKAMSLDGTLAVAFGSRGKGGKGAGAAHYEADRTVINMTKIHGAGTLAHEWIHALDHYLGEFGTANPYRAGAKWISGGRVMPSHPERQWIGGYSGPYMTANGHLKPVLRQAVNKLMHDLFNVEENDAENERRLTKKIEDGKEGRQSWVNHANRIKDSIRKGGSSAGLKKAENQIEIWDRVLKKDEADLAAGKKKIGPTKFLQEAQKLSGKTGDYWRRPLELLARAGEAFIQDRIQAEGFVSQYLVQGTEQTRYAAGFKGNPYPVGDERKTINEDFERVLKALTTGEGKHGINTRLQSVEGEPPPIVTQVKVKTPTPQPKPIHEMIAVDEAATTSLSDQFAKHFGEGSGFKGILEARKFAKDASFADDPKAIEEALEFGVVKTARAIVAKGGTPKEVYDALVNLYDRQPRLGTRTSTSVRDQAYSTPVPLAYVASELAGINKETTVYEPSAGNGALLIAADPSKVLAVEQNLDRFKNLHEQGIKAVLTDATAYPATPDGWDRLGRVDRVIANPPFGPVKTEDVSKVFDMGDIQPNYETHEIDHAIALRALAGMKDNGKAVLILGGVNKLANTREARAAAYNGKAKREFFKTLYDRYGVTDHFTVNGDLYERQGAGWPVDVIVIDGRRKSSRALPAVDVPRIINDWTALGGLLDGHPNAGDVGTASGQHVGDDAERPGLAGSGIGSDGDVGQSGLRSPTGGGDAPGVVQEPVPLAGNGGSGKGGDKDGPGTRGSEPADRPDKPASAVGSSPGLDLDALIGSAIDDAYAPEVTTEKPNTTGLNGPKKRSENTGSDGPKKRSERTTEETIKSAAENASDAADQAFSGLYELFGGGKTHGAGPAFDDETYAKAKPFFKKAAEKFRDFWGDIGELIRRMVAHMRDTMKWPRDVMERMAPYLKRFIQDLQAGEKLGEEEAPKEKPRAAAGTAAETETQVRYNPKSKVQNLDTLVPVNMRRSVERSLDELERRVGPIDKFVAKELGLSQNSLEGYFGAEQVDAIALAIDNINRGKGFIIGDQTGIGKGRVNGAIMMWAIKNGRVPVFVTEKPNLYKDIYRDMMDIGMVPPRILATNAALDMPIEEEGGRVLKNGDSKLHDRLLASLNSKEAFDKHFDVVFTTYPQMNTVKGQDTGRRAFLRMIAPHSVVILDESHNAGGSPGGRKKKDAPPATSDFTRDLVRQANGVFYSSATYAKRPDVMDLYSATDMSMAVSDIRQLGDLIARGRVPMQQAVANMLSESGQYIRRERSFAGIEYNTARAPVDRNNYNNISHGLAAIQAFSKIVKRVTSGIADGLAGEGDTLGADNATGEAAANSTNFTSIMHNIINQMLLALKVEPAAQLAIDAIRRGEKPVITVSNTAESFLNDYADEIGIKVGDEMPADFSDVLQKYLDRTRTITIKEAFEKKGKKHYLTDDELGPEGVKAYQDAMELIASMDLSNLPVSPIDYLKGRLQKEGYRIGEITGRSTMLDYTGAGDPVLKTRPGIELTPNGKNAALKKFNTKPENGGHHALIINRSGSTGLSAHASKTFNDQSPRHMIIAQPEGNIDTHMQLLGRINRTGQVVLPRYTQMVADVPAEQRPAAVLAKKMASLNANTTASRTSAVTAKDTPDFINEYGDAIAAQWVLDNLDIHELMGLPINVTDSGKPTIPDAMRKLTGRIPLLPLEKQEGIYEELAGNYEDLMAQLSAAGTNPMEAKTYNLKAKTLETSEVQGKKNDSGSPFAAPVNVEKVSVARLGKPFKPYEVISKIKDALGPSTGVSDKEVWFRAMRENRVFSDGDTHVSKVMDDPIGVLGAEKGRKVMDFVADFKAKEAANAYVDEKTDIAKLARMLDEGNDDYTGIGRQSAAHEQAERKRVLAEFTEWAKPIIEGMPDAAKQENELAKLNALRYKWSAIHELVRIGQTFTLKTVDGNMTGIVTKVNQKGVTKNPLAMSSWGAEFAIADATRQIRLPFSRIVLDGRSDQDNALEVEVVPMARWIQSAEQTMERFQNGQSDAREERYIATGNLLAAYDWLNGKGAIINYTDTKGGIRQGIITPKDFDLTKHSLDKGKIVEDPAEIKAWLDNNPTETIHSKGSHVTIKKQDRWSDDYTVSVNKSKKDGGIYFLDRPLVALSSGDFMSRGGRMVTDVSGKKLTTAIARMQGLGAVFKISAEPPKPTKVKDDEDALAHISPAAAEKRPEIEGLVRDILKHLVGDHVTVELSPSLLPLPGVAAKAWGRLAFEVAGARGLYYPSLHLIKLALLRGVDSTAFHEAYHAIEYQLQSPQERALMEREIGRIRDYVQKKRGYTKAEVDGLGPEEVRAIGFEEYATDRSRGKGLHFTVKRWYQRLWEAIQRIINGLRNLGFQRFEDIYDKAYKGGYRDAKGDTPRREAKPREEAAGEHASIDPDDQALASIFEKRTRGNTRVSEAIGSLFSDSRKADVVEALSDLSHREKLLQKEVEARYLGLTPEEANKVFPEASNLPDAMQFYVKKELIPGKVAYQANEFRTRLLKPLIETANRAKITLPELGDYLMAKGALERNRNTAQLYEPGHPFNDAMRDNNIDGGSGFSNNEARDKIREFEDGPRGNAFKSIWRQTRNIVDFTRQMMVHYGLESQATIDAWRQRGPDYVPFKGFEEADIDDELYFGSKGSPIGIRAPESKRAFGRTSKADNPMVHLIDQAYRTIERGERNMHYQSLAETLATLKASGINISDFVSLNKGVPKQIVDRHTGLARWIDTSPSAMAKGAVNFKRNGAPRTMLFKSEKLAQSINRNAPWTFPGLRAVLLGVNKLKSLWTHYSPDFAARHFFGRYMVEGALNAYQLKDTGDYSPRKWIADAFPGIGRASRAISNHEKGRQSGQLGAYWAEMKAGGGSMAFRQMRDIDSIKNELVEDLKQITTRSRLNPLRVLKGIIEKTDEIFNVWDNATRLATYAQARDQGMSPQAAAYRSRNATVNYQKRANLSSVIGALMPFYNTAVRTGTRLSGAMAQSHTMRKVAVGVFAAGVALALNNYLLGGSDDNGVPYFEKVPPYERALGFIVLDPFERDAQGRPQKYALPNAYNYALPMTLGYHLTGMLLDKVGAIKSTISVGEHLLEATKSTLMAFTPLGEFGNLMDMITPELLRPVAHVIENKNWLGNPVHNDMFQKGPNSESGRKAHGDYVPTGEGWKDAAKALNSATGGDQHHSGLIDMYPEDIRELADQMFGAQKRFGIEVGNTAGSIMKGEMPKATDVPIARVFRGIDYDQADAVEKAKHRYEQTHPWQR